MANILIVDDSKDLIDFLSLLLRTQHFEVDAVTSKKELIHHLLSKSLPDIILLDVRLVDGDGRKICSELKGNSTFKHIPIILISASPELLENHTDYNADTIIEKPFDLKSMIQKINGVLSVSSK